MQGLLTAALCLTAAFVSASPLPEGRDLDFPPVDFSSPSISSASVTVRPKDAPEDVSPDDNDLQDLLFRVDVAGFHDACDYDQVTVNDQRLSHDVTVNGDRLTGQGAVSLEDQRVVGASWSFQCVKTDGRPDHIFMEFDINSIDGKPTEQSGFKLAFSQTDSPVFLFVDAFNYVVSESVSEKHGILPAEFNLEDDLAELQWMRAQLRELKYLISEKERALFEQGVEGVRGHIKDCDSLKCVAQIAFSKAHDAANKVLGKITGGHNMDEVVGTKPKGNHGNHTCGHPHHETGNHTHPQPPHRLPHHRPPHHRPLPICRYPFPRRPHHRPRPPHHGKPPGHGQHDRPPQGMPGGPPPGTVEDNSLNYIEPFGGDLPRPGYGSRHFHPRTFKIFHALMLTGAGLILALCLGVAKYCHYRRRMIRDKEERLLREEARRQRRAQRRVAFQASISRVLAQFSRRSSSPHGSDVERAEERADSISDAEDGLSTTMSEEIAQFQNVVSMVDDIVHAEQTRALRIPTRQSAPPISTLGRSLSLEELRSEVGDEELPAYAYEDNSLPGTDDVSGSIVTDGFRYTPGSSDYTPSQSPVGSVSDVLGPDTKQ